MVSISNISAGQAGSYYQRDSYYTQSPGSWQGAGAVALGLEGEITRDDFLELIEGRFKGNQLVEGSRANGGEHRAGIDLTFSAPKSVSIVAEVLGDEKVRLAHEKAVSTTLNFVEKNFSQARQTVNGQTERVDTSNLVIAKFNHNTSRELDPQVHTHAFVMNMTQRPDGEWRALSNENLFEQKMLIGQIYRNELAANLKELGYSIQADNKGLFEIKGIDQKVLDHFSQRTEQINQKVAELKESDQYQGMNDQKLREIASLGSRVAKQSVDMSTIREAWSERLQAQGYTKEQLKESIQKAAEHSKEHRATSAKEYIGRAAGILTEQEATFTREELLKTASKLSIGEHRIGDLERAIRNEKVIVSLDKDKGIYTTREMQKLEKEIADKVKDGQGKTAPILAPEKATEAIKNYEARNFTLTEGQRNAAIHIFSTGDRVIGVQGDAGTGKTTMLTAVREQLELKGYVPLGLGFTGKAAEEVEKNAGIKSQTIHSFLSSNEAINERTVLIVDEASMIGSRQMHEVISRAKLAGARVVLIGDTKQLQAISAGRMFDKLQGTGVMKTVEMKDVLRQKEQGYKEVIKDISDRKIDSAFSKLEKQGRINEVQDRGDRLNKIVQDYVSRKDYPEALIVTARNDDRNELNQTIRAELKNQGRLSGQEYTLTVRESKGISPLERHFAQSYQPGEVVFSQVAGIIGRAGAEARIIGVDKQNHVLEVMRADLKVFKIDLRTQGQHLQSFTEKEAAFAQGERIVFLKNDRGLGVKNGVTATVEQIKGEVIRAVTDTGKELTFSAKQYPYLSHGYAVTDYKSQGQTMREVLYHADTAQRANYNQAYVALTRGKEDVRVYTDNKEALKEQVKVAQEKTSTLDHSREAGQEKFTNREATNSKVESRDPVKIEKTGEKIQRNDSREIER